MFNWNSRTFMEKLKEAAEKLRRWIDENLFPFPYIPAPA